MQDKSVSIKEYVDTTRRLRQTVLIITRLFFLILFNKIVEIVNIAIWFNLKISVE